jgi:hypothetical protein
MTMHRFLLSLGAVVVLMGMILVLSNLKNVARRKRILGTATSPISQAMGGPVEIKGNIVPSEKGLVEAPLSFYEELLTPGDAIYARGPSRRDQGEPNSEGSGFAPSGQLVMYADTGPGGELILTNKTEKQLASRLLRNFVIGIACTIAGALIITGAVVWVPRPQASQAQAQSDLAVLHHDDGFVGGDLRALSSDARLADSDLTATKAMLPSEPTATTCQPSKLTPPMSRLMLPPSALMSTLSSDIGAVTQDVAAIRNDLANLTASGPPATPGAAAGKATRQTAIKANGEIDQVNADVTQAYSIANGIATGSCAGHGPGRPPIPIRHISSRL